MLKSKVREILSAYRAGGPETEEPLFKQAKAAAAADPELAQWWAEQQEFDRVIATKLAGAEVPRDLQARIMAQKERAPSQIERHLSVRSGWSRGLLLAAASIVALAVIFSSWRGAFQPAASLADFRDEMVSFVRLDPPLDVESSQLARLTAFLQEHGAPAQLHLPEKLQQLDAVGCRRLRYRGQEVALVCFKRADGELVHMFAIDRSAFAKRKGNRTDPDFVLEKDWATASWAEGDHVYLLATKGSRETLQQYLRSS